MAVIGYVEDDPLISSIYIDLLNGDGYDVIAHNNRKDAINAFSQHHIDLAVLDLELGDDKFGGLEICKTLRRDNPDLPIIFLTSHTHIDMQSRGWRLGADDYLAKDTALELVLLRIRVLLKRFNELKRTFSQAALEDRVTSNGLHIEEEKFKIYWASRPLELSLTQFWILNAIVKGNGKAVGHEKLQAAANIFVEPNTIVAHIKTIREQFKKIDPEFSCLKTERGRGYRWVE